MTNLTLSVIDSQGNERTVNTTPNTGQAPSASSLPVVLSSDQTPIATYSAAGIGGMALVPVGSVVGVALGVPPVGASGCRLYLGAADSVTFTITNVQPTTAPAATFTVTGSTTGPNWDENLSDGQMVYVTAMSGTPKFRFI